MMLSALTPTGKKKAYISALNSDARNAHLSAKAYLLDHPKAKVVTCEDMEKAGYIPSRDVTCFSDMTAISGSIRMSGPESGS